MAFPRFLNAITIDSSNDDLEFDEGGGNLTASLTNGTYFVRGGGAAGDLLGHIATRMGAAPGAANTYTVTVDSVGTVTIARDVGAANFTLHWNSGPLATRNLAPILGYLTAADDGPGTTFASDSQHQYGWYPEKHLLDGIRRLETAVGGAVRSMGNQQYTQQWSTDWRTTARIDFVPIAKVRRNDVTDAATAAANNEAFTGSGATTTNFYEQARLGNRFEFHPDASVVSFATAVIDPEAGDWFEDIEAATELLMEAGEKYRVLVPMRPYQS